MATPDQFDRAMRLVEQGLIAQQTGDLDEAIRLYQSSIRLCPTADAHTYLGWAYSLRGELDAAIAECETAIRLDPEFGNPYNDIGVYLMQKSQLDEAIPWLEKAKQAQRYEPRHFPYLNLGRIYARKGMLLKAQEEFASALRLHPHDELALRAIQEIQSRLN